MVAIGVLAADDYVAVRHYKRDTHQTRPLKTDIRDVAAHESEAKMDGN